MSGKTGGRTCSCPECGKEFVRDGTCSRKVYCTRRCKGRARSREWRARNRGGVKVCPVCQKEFEKSNRKYCSDDCMRVAKNEQNKRYTARIRAQREPRVKVERVKVVAVCEVCGNEFVKPRSNARYCSEKCGEDAQRKRMRERLRLAREEKAKVEKKVEKKVTGQSVNYAERVTVKISEDKFARCDLCGKEYVKTKQAEGRCPVCRGVYDSRRVYSEIGSGWGV